MRHQLDTHTNPRPFQPFNGIMRLDIAASKLAARRKMKKRIEATVLQMQTPLVADEEQQQEPTVPQDNLPCIQTWIYHERNSRGAAGGPKRNDLKVLSLMELDVTWLDGVFQELVQIVPVGHMSHAACSLTQALIRALVQHKSRHSRTLVDDLFKRLIQEEDGSAKQIVTAVLYGVVTRHFTDPLQAASLLELMRDRHRLFPKMCAKPMKSNLTSVLYCWTKSDLPQAPYMAHNLLTMISKPNLAMYNTVLHAYYRKKMPVEADELLNQLEQEGVKLNVHSFLFCIMAWEQDATRAIAVMERLCLVQDLHPTTLAFLAVMQAIYTSMPDPGPKVAGWMNRLQRYRMELPDELRLRNDYAVGQAIYQVVMKSWAKSTQPQEVDAVIEEMRSLGITLNASCWTIVVQAWSTFNVEHAETIVLKLGNDNNLVQPTLTMCHFILEGWSKLENPERCQSFFDWMCEHNIHPDATSFKFVFISWNKGTSNKNAGKHILSFLRNIEKYDSIQLDTSIYELVLRTLAVTHKRKVLMFLKRLECMHHQGIHGISPECYNLALASSSGIKEVEDVFSRMKSIQFRPTTESFNFILQEWAKSSRPDAAHTANLVLERMKTELVKPNADTYNYILAICMYSKNRDTIKIARSIMVRLVTAYHSGDLSMLPSANILLRITENNNGPRLRTNANIVQEMVSDMEGFPHQDFATSYYTFSLTVCSMSLDTDAPSIARTLWERMIRCNLRCFNLVLKTYARHAVPHKAEYLFESHGTGYSWVPDHESFEYLLEAWARSKELNAAQRAFYLLEQRIGKPTPLAFANVLLACSMTPGGDSGTKLHQYNLAIRTFQCLKDAGHPATSLHFYRLLMCAIHLAPDATSRVGMATFIFRQCCKEGQVDQWILRRFWSIATKLVRQQLLNNDDDNISLSQLPKNWICHRLCTC